MELTPLTECPIGLFWSSANELCLKTEYGNNEGRIDAYIVSSGEFFWGDAPQTIESQRRQLVRPVDTDEAFAALTRPTADLGEELVERGARRLYRDYEETTDEHADLIFTSADPECASLADEMREWFKAAFEASGAADRLILYREALAELLAAVDCAPANSRRGLSRQRAKARALLSKSGDD